MIYNTQIQTLSSTQQYTIHLNTSSKAPYCNYRQYWKGFKDTEIFYNSTASVWQLANMDTGGIYATYNGTKMVPVGIVTWKVEAEVCGESLTTELMLSRLVMLPINANISVLKTLPTVDARKISSVVAMVAASAWSKNVTAWLIVMINLMKTSVT